jgi:phosphohistidine phosphatase SixA
MHRLAGAFCALAMTILPGLGFAEPSKGDAWRALAAGTHVAMMRHALAPGTGDPANIRIGDCSTQRNLNETGRAQARAIGDAFRANGIAEAEVFTSQWCRCRETADLLDLGAPSDLPALNSFFGNRADGPGQTEALRDWLTARVPGKPLVLVTHQVNITALTGIFPSSGEMVVFRLTADGSVEVAGTVLVR